MREPAYPITPPSHKSIDRSNGVGLGYSGLWTQEQVAGTGRGRGREQAGVGVRDDGVSGEGTHEARCGEVWQGVCGTAGVVE